jgi:hypothetical protein
MRVKCIDNSGGIASGAEKYLVVGTIYEVEDIRGPVEGSGDFVLVGVPMTWRRSRFVSVSEEPTLAIRQEKPCQVCKRNNDVGVATCWNCGNKP